MKQINKYLQAEASTNKDRVTIQALSSQGEIAGTIELTRAELAEVNRLVEPTTTNHESMLLEIQSILSDEEWSPDTPEFIAEVLTNNGYKIEDNDQ